MLKPSFKKTVDNFTCNLAHLNISVKNQQEQKASILT